MLTGQYNYGSRDYDPGTGRFVTVDPIRDGMNWYVYVANDPVNYVDLWGLAAEDVGKSYTKYGIGIKGAIVLGLGIEAGLIRSDEGNWGVYGTISVGTGVQVGVPVSTSNIVKQIVKPLLGGGGSKNAGEISDAGGSSLTADAGVLISGTWDLNNLNENGTPNGIGGFSVGGGVWKSWSRSYIPKTKTGE